MQSDTITAAVGWHEEKGRTVSLLVVTDDRLHAGQRDRHLATRTRSEAELLDAGRHPFCGRRAFLKRHHAAFRNALSRDETATRCDPDRCHEPVIRAR